MVNTVGDIRKYSCSFVQHIRSLKYSLNLSQFILWSPSHKIVPYCIVLLNDRSQVVWMKRFLSHADKRHMHMSWAQNKALLWLLCS
jgi:hypothetical protein